MSDSHNKTKRGRTIVTKDNDYIKHFKASDTAMPPEEYDSIVEAFKIALRTREFEIDLYWKRANYFWLFVSVIFVGWYTVSFSSSCKDSHFFIQFLLALTGFIVSFCWYCVNRGSKYWQENWETNIKYLSKKLDTPIFGMVAYHQESVWNPIKPYPYSVSKVNQVVSLFISIIWIAIGCYQIYTNYNLWWCLGYIVFLVGILIGIHFLSESFVCKENKKSSQKETTKSKLTDPIFYNY